MSCPWKWCLHVGVALALSTLLFAEESKLETGDKRLPMAGESLRFDGRDAFVIAPKEAAKGRPWVWYAPTLPRLPGTEESWYFARLLAEGIAIAGIDVGESYGNPEGRSVFEAFRSHLAQARGFSERPCLLVRSRGGLMLYNWAVEHPDHVAGVAGVYPVCNLASYPGLAKAAPAYGMSEKEIEKVLTDHNPIDRLRPLAVAKVPILHLHGDRDRVVPLEKNSAALADNYRRFGGPVEVELIEGGGHDMAKHWFQSEKLVRFMIEKAKAGAMTAPAE